MHDVIVVGARCAGAVTAMLLARRGHRVLLIDRSTFPSDLVMSTHLIWQPGVAKLASWGLSEALAATGCPPLTTARIDFGPFALTGSFPPAEGVAEAYSPRRHVLDHLLVEAAVAAGAELREDTTVDALRSDDGAVTGISARSRSGVGFAADARLVVGADGMHSTIARLVHAPEYHTRPPLQGTYFTYWAGVPIDGVELYLRDWRAAYGWLTNDDLALVGVNWTASDFPAARADIAGHYQRVLADAAPALAARVQAGSQAGRWVGGAITNYFRTPFGPGWALVGDAGYQKDPCTAQGISDAFSHAELLAAAIDDGLSGRRPMHEALAGYERARNHAALPMYEFTCAMASFAPPPPELQALVSSLIDDQYRTERFLGLFAGTVPMTEFFPDADPPHSAAAGAAEGVPE